MRQSAGALYSCATRAPAPPALDVIAGRSRRREEWMLASKRLILEIAAALLLILICRAVWGPAERCNEGLQELGSRHESAIDQIRQESEERAERLAASEAEAVFRAFAAGIQGDVSAREKEKLLRAKKASPPPAPRRLRPPPHARRRRSDQQQRDLHRKRYSRGTDLLLDTPRLLGPGGNFTADPTRRPPRHNRACGTAAGPAGRKGDLVAELPDGR